MRKKSHPRPRYAINISLYSPGLITFLTAGPLFVLSLLPPCALSFRVHPGLLIKAFSALHALAPPLSIKTEFISQERMINNVSNIYNNLCLGKVQAVWRVFPPEALKRERGGGCDGITRGTINKFCILPATETLIVLFLHQDSVSMDYLLGYETLILLLLSRRCRTEDFFWWSVLLSWHLAVRS